jgi:hypothetical protein
MDTNDRWAKVCSTASCDQMKERDKLQLFWKHFSIVKLKHAMRGVNNYTMDSVGCNCLACAASGRKDEDNGIPVSGPDCIFKLYFESLLKKIGFSVEPCSGEPLLHASDASVYNNDSHFVTIDHPDWISFSYGAKLWKCSSNDPDLQKLERLFEMLAQIR